MCWPTYLTSNPQENLDDLEFPMKLSKNLPKLPLILIFEIRPNDLQDRHGSPKCSKTSTGSFPLSLQPNMKWTTHSPATQPEIDDGDDLQFMASDLSRNCYWKRFKANNKSTPCWVHQVETLKQQALNAYDPPSIRLIQSRIMNILTKTMATYMFLRHLNNPREENEI
jgi:hypothetical protein